MKVACFTLLLCFTPIAVKAESSIVRFQYWGALRDWDLTTVPGKDLSTRLGLYHGWVGGFLAGTTVDAIATPKQGKAIENRAIGLTTCLDDLSYDQVIAMIDKYYYAHPEEWSKPLAIGNSIRAHRRGLSLL